MKNYLPGLALLLSLTSAAAVDDPWSLVPSLPDACYDNQDQLAGRITVGIATLDEEIIAQNERNNEISGQFNDMAEADPFEMAQRMQQYLLDNPEESMAMMEKLYATGQTVYEDTTARYEREQELTTVLENIIVRYRAAFADMRAPFDAQYAALPTEDKGVHYGLTSEGIAQLPVISQQAGIAYEQFCAKWWKSGPFAAPLSELRKFLSDEKVPREEELFEQGRQQLDIQGVDTGEYRATASMEAARSYLQQLQRVYAERLEAPIIYEDRGGL